MEVVLFVVNLQSFSPKSLKAEKYQLPSITIAIFKKSNTTDPRNYPGITLLSSALKLMTNILAEEFAQRNKRILEKLDTQLMQYSQ